MKIFSNVPRLSRDVSPFFTSVTSSYPAILIVPVPFLGTNTPPTNISFSLQNSGHACCRLISPPPYILVCDFYFHRCLYPLGPSMGFAHLLTAPSLSQGGLVASSPAAGLFPDGTPVFPGDGTGLFCPLSPTLWLVFLLLATGVSYSVCSLDGSNDSASFRNLASCGSSQRPPLAYWPYQ